MAAEHSGQRFRRVRACVGGVTAQGLHCLCVMFRELTFNGLFSTRCFERPVGPKELREK